MVCEYNIKKTPGSKTVIINCRTCIKGNSTIFDKECRKNIFKIIQNENIVTRVIFNHVFVKVFQDQEMEMLKSLTNFIDALSTYINLDLPGKNTEICKKCNSQRYSQLKKIIDISKMNPVLSFLYLKKIHDSKAKKNAGCIKCGKSYTNLIDEMISKAEFSKYIQLENFSIDLFYRNYIRPYVRPGFIDSYIQLEPPHDAIFLESYEVRRKGRRPMNVTLYTLKTKPEKLYFVVPPEYNLPREELYLLEKVKMYLSRHRPKDASFMDANSAREYFQRLGKIVIADFSKDMNLSLSASRIEYLSDIFSRYTAGFGILEDLLTDQRIQDIYINAPVMNNPLHIVVEGEEYASNIYLSNGDIDALASRFRTISGRAFSEAAPVLDMDLESYHTRVAAISNPLTPKGIAFALRRHRQKPWTLSHFVSNNMLSAEAAGFLSFLVDGQASLLVAGSRGAGKTSLLGALILEIPQRFRILTIEDTPEISVESLQKYGYKIQSLITKSISSGGASTEVTPTDALRTALRLGESVLIIGEVRGVEAKVLFEAMRVGAAGNLIMGTIHGSTTRDVYERVVFDIGVPSTSFKAVDAVVIAAPIRADGGIDRKRRVIQISEITKTGWTKDPDPDKVFQDIMKYNASQDALLATNLLDMGQSQVIENISKKWGINVEKALQNIRLRTNIKKTIVKNSKDKPELLEAQPNMDANNAFWMFIEESKMEDKKVNYEKVWARWLEWFEVYIGKKQ